MPLPKYYCDYCERAFNDTPQTRKKHFESKYHKNQVRLHYETFKDASQILQEQIQRAPCYNLLIKGFCEYGINCRYSHRLTTFGGTKEIPIMIGNTLPPSLARPPEGGYSLEDIKKAQWG